MFLFLFCLTTGCVSSSFVSELSPPLQNILQGWLEFRGQDGVLIVQLNVTKQDFKAICRYVKGKQITLCLQVSGRTTYVYVEKVAQR